MDIKQLYYFKTIVEEGTISKAAKVLHMAQPPLSMQLKTLEEELNVVLLKRLPRHIELTEEGALLYKRSIQILDLFTETQREIKDIHFKQKIHIGITSSNGGLLMNPCIEVFKQKYPDLVFEIHEGDTYEMIDLVKSHIVDLAFIRTPFDSTGLNFKYLQKEPMIAIGSQRFLNKQTAISLKELSQYPWIIYRRYENLIMDTCMNLHVSPNILCKNDDCRTSLLWASHHQGVAIVPKSAVYLQMMRDDVYMIPIEHVELYTNIVVVWRHDQDISPVIKELIASYV